MNVCHEKILVLLDAINACLAGQRGLSRCNEGIYRRCGINQEYRNPDGDLSRRDCNHSGKMEFDGLRPIKRRQRLEAERCNRAPRVKVTHLLPAQQSLSSYSPPPPPAYRTKVAAAAGMQQRRKYLRPKNSKTRGFHGGDYEEWRLMGCYAVWLL
jgi:hypothetical protein